MSDAVLPAIYLAVYMYIRQPSRRGSSIKFAFIVLLCYLFSDLSLCKGEH
jgi:hypothetical protein